MLINNQACTHTYTPCTDPLFTHLWFLLCSGGLPRDDHCLVAESGVPSAAGARGLCPVARGKEQFIIKAHVKSEHTPFAQLLKV